jgi:protein-S-isoprenylcysteine O-methyltransferase Ste14
MPEKDRPNINKNIHPPLVAVFYIAIAYLLKWIIPIPYAAPNVLRNAAFGLVIVGFFLGVAALIEFKKARTTLDPHGSAKALVVSGVYRFTRNPIYLGFLLMVIGIPLNADNYYGLLISPFFMITISRLVIEREENYLEKKFGKEYTGYKSRVRRWL